MNNLLYPAADFDDVFGEMVKGHGLFGKFQSAHEAHSVIREEVEELWDIVKATKTRGFDDQNGARKELIQIMACCARALQYFDL